MLPARDRVIIIKVYDQKTDMQQDVNGTSYSEGIVSGTARLERVFYSQLPGFGECNAAQFECEMHIDEDLTGKWLRVAMQAYATEQATTRTNIWLFAGKVDSCTYDRRQATRTLVAYDEMQSLRDVDISSWWKTYWSGKTAEVSAGTVISDMMQAHGVQGTAGTSYGAFFSINPADQNNLFTSCSFAQMLSYFGQIKPASFYFNTAGMLTLCDYSTVNKTGTAIALDDGVDTVMSSFGDAEGPEFNSAVINVGSETAYRSGQTEPTFSQTNNPLLNGKDAATYTSITSNLLTVAKKMSSLRSAELELIVSTNDLLARTAPVSYNGVVYMPSAITMYGDQLINETISCTNELADAPSFRQAITSEDIVDGAIKAPKIAAKAVTADKISVSDLSALQATIGGWEIGTNFLRRIVTIGQYDYQVILYAPENPLSTTGGVAVQRRLTGSGAAWTSVTRMTYGGQLISTDADIAGTITTGNITATGGSVGGLTIEQNAIKSSNNNFSVSAAGALTANSGTIGGWTVVSTGLYRVITSGAYDYRVLLYAPEQTTDTTTTIAIQRRAAGTSDAWASVTRMTYGGALITNALTAEGGTIGGWGIAANSLEKSQTVGGVQYKAGLYAPGSLTADAEALKVQRGSGNDRDELSVKYNGSIAATNKVNAETTNTIGVNGSGFETKSEYHDYVNTDQNRRGYASLNGSSFSLQNAKRGSGGEVNERPAFEAIVEARENGATVDIMAHTGDSDEAEASLDVSDGFASLFLNDGTDYSRLASDGLTVKGVDFFTPDSGSGTRNTTNTSSGTLNYWKLGRIVVVSMTGTAPAVTTANAVLFSGLPAAIDSFSFPAIPTTARGAARFYVDTAGNVKIGGNATAAQTYLANFTYIAAV